MGLIAATVKWEGVAKSRADKLLFIGSGVARMGPMNRITTAVLLLMLATLPARADLPAGFNWSDDNVRSLAEKNPGALASANPSERAKIVGVLMDGSSSARAAIIPVLQQASPVDRFKTTQILDRSDATDVRKVYDSLSSGDQAKLLQLQQASGDAAKSAGLLETGIISDNDDTAFPTAFTPDGPYQFNGAADFYKMVGLGTDGKGDPSNIHYVSARLPVFFPDSRARLAAAGLPDGTFDGDKSVTRFVFGGLDGIQTSKIQNIDLWLKLHPDQRFVFLGDSLQRDPEVYDWVLKNHPDQVEMVLIHKAGGPVRNPADYKGEVFFDDYAQATRIVEAAGIPQPGAKQPDRTPDIASLPLPDTDVSKLTAAESHENFLTKAWDFLKENVGDLFHKPAAAAPAKADLTDERGPRTGPGITDVLTRDMAEQDPKDAAEGK